MADLITAADLAASCPALAGRADLARLVSAASRAVERHCGRSFALATAPERHDGRGLPRVWLRRRPVASVASVSIDGQALDNTLGDAWAFDADSGELVRGSGRGDTRFAPAFPRGKGNILVEYTAGYDPIPEDVQYATILAANWLAGRADTSGAVKSESMGAYSYTLADGDDPVEGGAAAGLLAPYVNDPVC